MSIFKQEKTLEELEEENEKLEKQKDNYKYQYDIARLKKQIDSQGGQGFWKKIVGDSHGKGAVSKMWSWLRSH